MTALKPIENRRVRGVPAERYPLNATCAHPECAEPAADPHHVFPRSAIGNDSWFVCITDDDGEYAMVESEPIPHVSGLCRAHHDAVELHDAWIKLEDGLFVWYDRCAPGEYGDEWRPIGPLDPQPAGRAKSGKPKRRRFQGEERRKRRTISVKVPQDTEDGGAVWDETLERVKQRLIQMDLYTEGDTIPAYEALIAALTDWLDRTEYEIDAERVG